MAKVPILVLTTSGTTREEFRRQLPRFFLVEGDDFRVFGSELSLEQEIVSNERLLLVVGLIFGHHSSTVRFTRRMKEKYPNLLIVSFVTTPIEDESFDLVIRKPNLLSDSCTNLIPTLKHFLMNRIVLRSA